MHPHTQTVAQRHQLLDDRIAREQARAGSSDAEVMRLKKAKLALKDELGRAPG